MVKHKRGVAVATAFLFGAVLAVMLGLIVLDLVDIFSNEEEFAKFAVAKDVAILLDTTQATPRSIHYEYPETVYGSNLEIKEGIVSVVAYEEDLSDRGTFISSQYPFDDGSVYDIDEVKVNAGSFIIDKKAERITVSEESVDQEVLVQDAFKQSRKDLVIHVQQQEQEQLTDSQLLTQFKNSLEGRLTTRGFTLGTESEATLYLGVSLQEDNALYHSSSIETKELAQAIRTLSLASQSFTVIEGKNLFDDSHFFLEISIGREMKDTFSSEEQQVFAQHVVNALETVYE